MLFRIFHICHLKTFHKVPMEEQQVSRGQVSAAQLWVPGTGQWQCLWLVPCLKVLAAKGLLKP